MGFIDDNNIQNVMLQYDAQILTRDRPIIGSNIFSIIAVVFCMIADKTNF